MYIRLPAEQERQVASRILFQILCDAKALSSSPTASHMRIAERTQAFLIDHSSMLDRPVEDAG